MKSTLFSATFLLTCLTVSATATAAGYSTTLYQQPDGTYKEGADSGNLIGQVVNPDGLISGIGVTYKAPEGQFWTVGNGDTSGSFGYRLQTASGYDGFVGDSSLSFNYNGSRAYYCGSGGKYPQGGLQSVCMWGQPGLPEGPDDGIIIFDELEFAYSVLNSGSTVEFSLESVSDSFRRTPMSSLPVSAVPIPAAAFMFAPALLGFMGLRHKAKKLAA